MIDMLGYAAFAVDVLATWLFTSKHLWAWPVSLLSLALWFGYGWARDEAPIIVSTTTFSVICMYGWWRWWKDDEKREKGLKPNSRNQKVKKF